MQGGDAPDLVAGGRVEGADLSQAEWSGRNLEELELIGCTLEDVHAAEVLLRGARFVDCRFVRCRFAHADLREATFERCNFVDAANHDGVQIAFSRLDEARLTSCDLSFADIDTSNFYGVVAKDCSFRGGRFHRVEFGRSFGRAAASNDVTFESCNLQLVDLSEARLSECRLTNSILREADLSNADLEGADLRGCDLFLAQTQGLKLAKADLRGAKLGGINPAKLRTIKDAKVTIAQAQDLLGAMGFKVSAK